MEKVLWKEKPQCSEHWEKLGGEYIVELSLDLSKIPSLIYLTAYKIWTESNFTVLFKCLRWADYK